MHLPEFNYYEPHSLDEAVECLNEGQRGAVVAGGTDLVVALKQRLQKPGFLLSLDKIPSLKGIKSSNEFLSLGAMTTLEEIIKSSLIKERFPALSKAAREVGSPLLRNIATIGGNICLNSRCRFYNQSAFWRSANDLCYKAGGITCHVTKRKNYCASTFCADIPPVLLAYGAVVKLVGPQGERTIMLKDFYTGEGRFPNEIMAGSREILTEVTIPFPPAELKSTYYKFRLRDSIDFPLIGVAVAFEADEKGRCKGIRLVFTGVGSGPFEFRHAGEMLSGSELKEELVAQVAERAAGEIHPLKTDLISPRYKREVAKVIIKEAIMEAGGGR